MICFDTNILIWAIRGAADKADREKAKRAKFLVREQSQHKAILLLPMPVVVEYLAGLHVNQHRRHRTKLRELFILGELDERAAGIAAEIESRRRRDAVKTGNTPRECVKTDVFITAIAIAAGARAIYTHNISDFTRLAAGKIEIRELPKLPREQIPLPFS